MCLRQNFHLGIFRSSVSNRQPLTALNHLSKMPNFDRGFHKFLWKKVQREADKGSRLLNEPGPSAFLREDVEQFEPNDYYDLFCSTFPTFMISLVAVAVKGQSLLKKETVQVLSLRSALITNFMII